MMAAVALICLTMTSVVFTSCGSDDDTAVNKEYTLKISLEVISAGELTSSQLSYLNDKFKDKETKNLFTGYYDAKAGADRAVDLSVSAIATGKIYAKGCEYKVYFKLFDSSNSQVYQKIIYVIEDNYKIDN